MKIGLFTLFLLVDFVTSTQLSLQKRLYQEILKENVNKNLIFSPFSIQLCLALSHAGARGSTADEISQAIGFSSSFNAKNMTNTLVSLKNKDILHIANKVYIKSGLTLKPEYQTSVRDDLKSDVESINFSNKQHAADLINHWIEEQTNHKIQNMIEAESLDEATRLILVNAVYFKSNWSQPFDTSKYNKLKFTNFDSTTSDVDPLYKTTHLNVARVPNGHVVQLPYSKAGTAMYLVIPDEVHGLTKVEQDVLNLNFNDLPMSNKYVNLEIPKLDFELELKLNEILKKLGIVTAFRHDADFSGMLTSPEHLLISEALHKAFIKVNKDGTEAGAATVIRKNVGMVPGPKPQIELHLKADHPFMFVIMSDAYDVPLFMGSVKHL